MLSIENESFINGGEGCSAMDLDEKHASTQLHNDQDAEEDALLKFIDYARSILSPLDDDDDDEEDDREEREKERPSWSWIASRLLRTCISYSSGVTAAILLAELSQAWNEQKKIIAPRKRPDCINQLKKKRSRAKLPSTITIDTIYEKNFLSLNSVLEAVIVEAFVLPGTKIYMLTLGDYWSSNTIDLYLHRRFYDLVSLDNGILKKGREVILTGCYLRTAHEGSGYLRILPTEYFVILLDEEQDDDAMLLGAQFCSDSFSSVSLDDFKRGVSYSLYARIEYIGPLETLNGGGGILRKQIRLVDNDGIHMNFLLWGEQVVLSNLFSVGSMLAVDKPYICKFEESNLETCGGPCLEYGSATHLYLVPFVQQGEQVCVALTPSRPQGSRLATSYLTQGPKFSQMTLPCNSQGSIDYSNYPVQCFITDLHDKMTGVSIYGVVMDIFRNTNTETCIFNLKIQDVTGTIWAKLQFSESWSLGRLSPGHIIFISGLTCTMTKHKRLEAWWVENDLGTSFVNISCLAAILNSSCLHKQSPLVDLSKQRIGTHICRVWLDQIEHCQTRVAHTECGHFVKTTPNGELVECEFCCCKCEARSTRRVFQLKLSVADETAKAFAWCTGQTATELLQISPDEFYELPEEEQVIYPCSLENEKYMVAVVNCEQQNTIFKDRMTTECEMVSWEITRAFKL